jgi:hypothetical protein
MDTASLSDGHLLSAAARKLGTSAGELMLRYYGSPEDAHAELEELDRTGRLQASLARLLRRELGRLQTPAE